MSPSRAPTDSELYRYLEAARRSFWLLIILPLVAVAAVVGVMAVVVTPKYTATAEVLISPTSTENLLLQLPTTPDNDRTRSVATEVALIQSRPIAQSVADSFPGIHGHVNALPKVHASALGNTDVIAVTISDSHASRAASLATAYAAAYIGQRKDEVIREVNAAETNLQTQIDAIQKQIAVYDAQLAQATPYNVQPIQDTVSPLRDALISQQSDLRSRFVSLQVQAGLVSGGARLVQTAAVPGSPSSPRKIRGAAIAAAAGLLVAFGVITVRETLDDRVHMASALADLAAVPVGIGPWWRRRRSRRAAGREDAYRRVRVTVEELAGRGTKVFLVTGPRGTEGIPAFVANLAVTLAGDDHTVLVIDADMRHPRVHNLFRVPNTERVVHAIAGVSGLSVLPSGPRPGELRTADVAESVRANRDRADVVLVVTPPVLSSGDVARLRDAADAVILVARLHVTSRSDLVEARDIARPHVLVLTDAAESRPRGLHDAGVASPPAEVDVPVEVSVADH